jgi:hypothetical protein
VWYVLFFVFFSIGPASSTAAYCITSPYFGKEKHLPQTVNGKEKKIYIDHTGGKHPNTTDDVIE